MEALTAWAIAHGPLGLFVVAFLAATILPFSSELALAGVIAAGASPTEAVIAASLGNCLACAFNYGLGYTAREKTQAKLEKYRAGRLAISWMDRYGAYSLLLSWLPIIGDPLTIVAGCAKVRWYVFVPIVFGARILRYVLLAAAL